METRLNDVEGCRSQKVLVQRNMRLFLQYTLFQIPRTGCST